MPNGIERVCAAFAGKGCSAPEGKPKVPAFMPFITAGYKTRGDTVKILLAFQESGANLIELGVPFSDPMADGKVIQRSSHIALTENEGGIPCSEVLSMVKEARSQGLTVPVILMGYYNPFMQFNVHNGDGSLMNEAVASGVDGFIVVDLPPDEELSWPIQCKEAGLCFVPLIAPTTTDARMEEIAKGACGFVYCVSLTGVTGGRKELPPDLKIFLERTRKYFNLPLAVGFGLRTKEHIRSVGAIAEGAIMGSAIVSCVGEGGDTTEARVASVSSFIKGILS